MRRAFIALVFATAVLAPGASRATRNDAPKPLPVADPRPDGARTLAQAAIECLKAKGARSLFEFAFADRKISAPLLDPVAGGAALSKQHDALVAQGGKPTGEVELVATEGASASLVRFVYVEKLQRAVIVWSLTFYRGEGDVWRWSGIGMRSPLDGDFRPVTSPGRDFDGARKLAEGGIARLKERGVPHLLDAVFADEGTVIPATARPGAEPTLVKVREIGVARYGKLIDEVELVRTETIGRSVIRFVYLDCSFRDSLGAGG